MKKYLGIVKEHFEGMTGLQISLLSRTYDDIDLINKWFDLYPNSEHTILLNNEELDSIFEVFKDMTPITDDEKKSMEEAKRLLRNLMED